MPPTYDGFVAIEEQVGLDGVAVAVAVPREEAERHERVEEVARRLAGAGPAAR